MSKAPHIVDSKTGRNKTTRIDLNNYPYTASLDNKTGDVYIGGAFTKTTSSGWQKAIGILDPSTGLVTQTLALALDAPYYVPNVNDIIDNGDGTYFIAGSFTHVNGIARRGLAKVDLNGTVYDWNPTTDGTVEWMVISGSVIYFGGNFTKVGGVTRNMIAAVSTTGTGAVTSWAPALVGPGSSLTNMYCHSGVLIGSVIYFGGRFVTVNGTSRLNAAAVDTSGTLQSWNPQIGSDDIYNRMVYKMIAVGTNIYIGGEFYQIGGSTVRWGACAVDTAGGISSWNPALNNGGNVRYCYDMVHVNGTIYYVGDFNTTASTSRPSMAGMTTAGSLTSWNPTITWQYASWFSVSNIETDGTYLYIQGPFTAVNGTSKLGSVKIDTSAVVQSAWNPNGEVPAIYKMITLGNGNKLVGCGDFLGGISRPYLISVKADGSLSNTSLSLDAAVNTTLVDGDILYIGGSFTTVLGNSRSNFAAVNIRTGAITSLNLSINGTVNSIIKYGEVIYIVGSFSSVGGQTRNNAAAIDTSGNLLSWNPNLNGNVSQIVGDVDSSVLYMCGDFTTINGVTSQRLVAVDTAGNKISTWLDPNINSTVRGVTQTGGSIYIGGYFGSIGGATRTYIGAVSKTTGAVTSWAPTVDSTVFAMASSGSQVYAAGYFSIVQGVSCISFTALDSTSAAIINGGIDMNAVQIPITSPNCLVPVENGVLQVSKPTGYGPSITRVFDSRYSKRRN